MYNNLTVEGNKRSGKRFFFKFSELLGEGIGHIDGKLQSEIERDNDEQWQKKKILCELQ